MKRLRLALIGSLLVAFSVFSAWASASEYRWGGPGYDHAMKAQNLSSRFCARQQLRDPSLVEVLVDTEITVKGTTIMELIPKRGAVLTSEMCWKALKHFTSPWACSFPRLDMDKLTGTGQLRVKDKKGRVLLKDQIDFDAVKNGLKAQP